MIRSTRKALWLALAVVALMPCIGFADLAGPQVINLWPGVAPGSEEWTQKERPSGASNRSAACGGVGPLSRQSRLPGLLGGGGGTGAHAAVIDPPS
jgi:hypothetical protein